MNKDFYISLIARKLSNELSASQLKDLSSWLQNSKDNAVLMDDFKSVWAMSGRYAQAPAMNVDSAFEKFSRRYAIPKADPADIKAIARKKFITSIGLPLLIIILLGITAWLYFSGYMIADKIRNDNMHAMTVQLDAFSELTLAPESGYTKGKSAQIEAEAMHQYEKLFTIVENNAAGQQNTHSGYYSPVATLFEPQARNYIIEDFTGQGFFELKSINENQAFLGLGGSWSVGTRDAAFNVQNYEGEDMIFDVMRGSVVFYDGNNNAYIIHKGERAVFEKNTGKLRADRRKDNSPFKWHKGILIFNNTPLAEVFDRIEKFYGVDIKVTDGSQMENINFTATLSMSNNLNDCLALLHESIDMTIRRKGLREIEISDIQSN